MQPDTRQFSRIWTICAGILLACIFSAFFIGNVPHAQAQKPADTTNTTFIKPSAKLLRFIKTDSGDINKFIGDAVFEQNGSFLYCDSAYFFLAKNTVEAFGSVKIIQPGGTQVTADYARYQGNKKLAYLKGNVSLTDGKSNLWCEELNYDLNTRIGVYNQGGTLQNESTTVSSNSGSYNVNTKDARFTGEVYITDPKYNVTSEDLGYNTQTRISKFYAPSIVTGDSSELHTNGGTWDGVNEIAHFTGRSSIRDNAQYIEANKLDYNRNTGKGTAEGKVISIDTTQRTTLYCGFAAYNQHARTILATVKPVMKKENGKDSLFIRADTFYSAPVSMLKDTAKKKAAAENKTGKKDKKAKQQAIVRTSDTAAADSTRPRYFIGYHNVLIFSDSLQGRCDSISYTQADSTMRMMKSPVVWARAGQVTGDTILLINDSGKVKKMFIPNNALVISRSGPEKANMYDQVQGKTLTGNMVNNVLDNIVVFPNAESIYYPKDDDGAYLGVNQAQGERMRVFFKDEKIDHIYFEQEVKQVMTPLPKANIAEMKLGRFKWLEDYRPRSREELFR